MSCFTRRTLWDVARRLPVTSFIAEALQQPPELEAVSCVTVLQTAAEKFVALTRRVAMETKLPSTQRDATLVRHIYDLHAIREKFDLQQAAILAREIMNNNAKEFGNQHPAYQDNCAAETQRAIDALSNDESYATQYAQFERDMVFGQTTVYSIALAKSQQILELLPE